jgi:hypothetical protein
MHSKTMDVFSASLVSFSKMGTLYLYVYTAFLLFSLKDVFVSFHEKCVVSRNMIAKFDIRSADTCICGVMYF